jgi:hypothetical protein
MLRDAVDLIHGSRQSHPVALGNLPILLWLFMPNELFKSIDDPPLRLRSAIPVEI